MRTLVLLLTLALTVAVPATAEADLGFEEVCVPTNGGNLDYYSEACVDADRQGCRVWHESPRSYDCYVRA